MKKVGDIGVVIQARIGSQRLPGKMVRPFAGSTLTDLAIQKVLRSRTIPRGNFHLAVHEPELVAIGQRHGVQIFHRSRRSAESETLREIYEWHDRLPYRWIVKINACAPMLSVETIDRFVETFLTSPGDGLFAVVRRRDYYWSQDGVMVTPWPDGLDILNTKLVGVTYQAAHCLYAGLREGIRDGVWMGRFGRPDDPALFPIDEPEAFDIDHEWQFVMAEAYFQRIASATPQGAPP